MKAQHRLVWLIVRTGTNLYMNSGREEPRLWVDSVDLATQYATKNAAELFYAGMDVELRQISFVAGVNILTLDCRQEGVKDER